MKYFLLIGFFCLHVSLCMARPCSQLVRYRSGTIMYATNNGKEVGRIYSFEIETRKPGIQIREVWFGNTPVPCDVYRSGQSVRCDSMLSPGFYTVRVNRDLFRNYPTQTDSTQAARQFKKPFSFRGDAVLLVQYKGKTCYRILNGVMPVKQKSYR